MSMTSSRGYLLRALNEWILDNNCTPYIVVSAEVEHVRVPDEYVNDGQIVLNITPSSIRNLLMDNDGVSFDARFNGKSVSLYAPINAITAIYARENGQGMVFAADAGPTDPAPPGGSSIKKPFATNILTKKPVAGGKPKFKVVK